MACILLGSLAHCLDNGAALRCFEELRWGRGTELILFMPCHGLPCPALPCHSTHGQAMLQRHARA